MGHLCLLAFFLVVAWQVDIAVALVAIPAESPTKATVPPNANDGYLVATVIAATDTADESITFSLTTQAPDTDPKLFVIGGTSGAITIVDSSALDFGTNTQYTLTITASEAGDSSVSETTTVTITAAVAPTFDQESYAACVNQDSTAGTSVVTVTASDANEGDTVSYSIIGGNEGTTFAANTNTGEITVAADTTVGETPASYNLTLTATDDGNTPLTGTTTVSVTVGNPCPNSAATTMVSFGLFLLSSVITALSIL